MAISSSHRMDFNRLLSDCSRTLLRIENLSINTPYLWKPREMLLSSTFSDLVRCTISGRWTFTKPDNTLASFLLRHPALKSIWIEDFRNFGPRPANSARIPLQHLERIRGPPTILPSIIAHLTEVKLEWRETDPVETTFATLKSLARSDGPFACCNFCGNRQCQKIVDSVSSNLPSIRTLELEGHDDLDVAVNLCNHPICCRLS